ncbi:coiled-coil domain-containing protein 93 [Pycnococcus provasolii]|uniref:Coiled-coil domain-containing protein 93 n=1 Tax=Pycnococcus provasolii TaxID=41880 RepID=A0A830HF70_9CHLO|nr:coiled-coil domain-containing protein 93 [Pycnococcus provasolii]
MDMSSTMSVESLREVLDLLLAGGYFRARLPSVTPFDKIVGGLSWAITMSSVDINFNLFFSEELKLGDKIALGEQIEASLKKMKCPHPLQAHQIQGLDLDALLPVVRWLVKQVIATRAEFGDVTRAYALYRHGTQYADVCDAVKEQLEGAKKNVEMLEKLAAKYRPMRTLRRRADVAPAEGAGAQERARWTLMEYGHRGLVQRYSPASTTSASTAAGTTASGSAAEGTAAASIDEDDATTMLTDASGGVSGAFAAGLVSMRGDEIAAAVSQAELGDGIGERLVAHSRKVAALEAARDTAEERASAAEARAKEAANALSDVQAEVANHKSAAEEARASVQNARAAAAANGTSEQLEAVVSKLRDVDAASARVKAYKAECRASLADLQAEAEAATSAAPLLSAEQASRIAEVDETYNAEMEKLSAARGAAARRQRAIDSLRRKLDAVPTRAELLQFERRFVELYEEVQAKLQETRRHYDTHNTLASELGFVTKEYSLLSSIKDQFSTATQSAETRANLVETLHGIFGSVTKLLEKTESKLAESVRLSALSDAQFASASERVREYNTRVRDLQSLSLSLERLYAQAKQHQL